MHINCINCTLFCEKITKIANKDFLHKVLLFDTLCIYLHCTPLWIESLDRKFPPAYRRICSWDFFKPSFVYPKRSYPSDGPPKYVKSIDLGTEGSNPSLATNYIPAELLTIATK